MKRDEEMLFRLKELIKANKEDIELVMKFGLFGCEKCVTFGSMINSKARVAPESRSPDAVALETLSGLSTGDKQMSSEETEVLLMKASEQIESLLADLEKIGGLIVNGISIVNDCGLKMVSIDTSPAPGTNWYKRVHSK